MDPPHVTSLKAHQKAPRKVSVTIDGWSANTTKASFLGITGHWINVDGSAWTLESAVLAFHCISGQHTGENLRRYFFALGEWAGIFTHNKTKVRCGKL
jgi:hypothetical protein